MPRLKLLNDSRGSLGIVYVLLILAIAGIGIVGWKVYERSTGDGTGQPGTLGYTTKDFGLLMDVAPDKNFAWQVSLTVDFGDSIVSDPCPQRVDGFNGDVRVSYEGSAAKLVISQGSRPAKQDTQSQEPVACPAVVTPAYSKKVTLNRDWMNRSDSHTIIANGKSYNLSRDKKDYTLTLTPPEGTKTITVYPPDKVVFLSSHQSSTYSTCMTEAQLEDYAAQHGLSLAGAKYPDFEPALRRLQPHLDQSDYYSPLLLVIANDGLNTVIENQSKRQPDDACNVWVGTRFDIEQIPSAN